MSRLRIRRSCKGVWFFVRKFCSQSKDVYTLILLFPQPVCWKSYQTLPCFASLRIKLNTSCIISVNITVYYFAPFRILRILLWLLPWIILWALLRLYTCKPQIKNYNRREKSSNIFLKRFLGHETHFIQASLNNGICIIPESFLVYQGIVMQS